MSQTYLAQIVMVLALVLPKIGVALPSDQLTTVVQGIVIVGGVFWTLYRRYQAGDITVAGTRKA